MIWFVKASGDCVNAIKKTKNKKNRIYTNHGNSCETIENLISVDNSY